MGVIIGAYGGTMGAHVNMGTMGLNVHIWPKYMELWEQIWVLWV